MKTKIGEQVDKYFQIKDLGVLIKNLMNIALIMASLICFVYLVWGGIDWITSAGDKNHYESARNKIVHALIGLAITATVWLGWKLALYFLGIGEMSNGHVIFHF